MLRKIFEAKEKNFPSVKVWGSGTPYREWMYSLDGAEAIVFLAENLSKEMLDDSPIGKAGWSHINIGSGEEVTIAELAKIISEVVGFKGKIEFDPSKPDGTPRKLIDSSFLHRLGWSRKVGLKEGIAFTFKWFKDQISDTPTSIKLIL
jgi:nucleoside-diphosphate-sugar epimerase